MRRSITVFIILVLSFNGNIYSSNNSTINYHSQWQNSPHAGSCSTTEETVRMNNPGCAHCHTVQGYQEVILQGKESSAPYKNVEGLTCKACHENENNKLRAGSVKEACDGCHNELATNEHDRLSWCSQFGTFLGEGKTFSGARYRMSSHTGLENGCVDCHMAEAPDSLETLVGGHTFRVMTKGDSATVFNNFPCRPCHNEVGLDFFRRSQTEVKELLISLAELLPQRPSRRDSTVTEPKYPADSTLTEIQSKASYNYYMIQRDGTFGVHNPFYVRDLLNSSIDAVEKEKGD